MAYQRSKGGILYLGWYDSLLGRDVQKSTGLPDTPVNRKIVNGIVTRLAKELDRKKQEYIGFRLNAVNIGETFVHLEKNYATAPKKTKKDIARFKKKFLEFFSESDQIARINKESCENFLHEIKKLDMMQNSIHAYGKRLKHYINFLFEENYIPPFKINRRVMTKAEKVKKITFKEGHYRHIFVNLYKKNSGFRTSVFLLAYSGLRSTDILQIKCEDIDLERRTIKFYSPKRKEPREIGFHKDLVPVLYERIDLLKTGKIIPYANEENLGRAVTRYYRQIDLYGHSYVTRTFRKTFVTYCLNTFKMDRAIVKELVGHKQGNVTDDNYNEISPEVMKNELIKFNFPLVDWMNNNDPNFKQKEELDMT